MMLMFHTNSFKFLFYFFFHNTTGRHAFTEIRVFDLLSFANPKCAFAIIVHGAKNFIQRLPSTKCFYQVVYVFTQHFKMFPLMLDVPAVLTYMFSMLFCIFR